jgi:L,D-transpeptidase-like protein
MRGARTAIVRVTGLLVVLAVASSVRAATPVWPRQEVLDLALRAWRCGRAAGEFTSPVLTVIDYSLPSSARRLWVIDVARHRVLFHELVAHGAGSGDDEVMTFSNEPGSRASSLGLFRTTDTYRGRHGQSLRLDGLEPGVNDRAMERAIVMHAAAYVSPAFVRARGRLGRSWGCPALDPRVHRQLIDRIKGGTAVFAYYPDARWLRRSRFLACEAGDGLEQAAVPARARRVAASES